MYKNSVNMNIEDMMAEKARTVLSGAFLEPLDSIRSSLPYGTNPL
jgi:hypothetical protein